MGRRRRAMLRTLSDDELEARHRAAHAEYDDYRRALTWVALASVALCLLILARVLWA